MRCLFFEASHRPPYLTQKCSLRCCEAPGSANTRVGRHCRASVVWLGAAGWARI